MRKQSDFEEEQDMKRIDWLKYAGYMRECIEAKYPDCAVVWAGENNFILVKDGKETRVKYD